jgi:hypothetical protein
MNLISTVQTRTDQLRHASINDYEVFISITLYSGHSVDKNCSIRN